MFKQVSGLSFKINKFLKMNKRFVALPQPIRNPDIKYSGIFVNNEWIQSYSGKSFETINPSTGEVITNVCQGEQADIENAVAAAQCAFKLDSAWRRMDASRRGFLLLRLADLIMRDRLYLASLETLDCGKPFKMSYNVDVPACANVLRYFAGWADKNHGKTIPTNGNLFAFTRHEPIGVCGLILPWNFPLLLWATKIGAALATGNTVVLKPAEQTPLTAMYAAQLCCEAGIPPGVVNVVPGFGNAGEALVCSMGVDKISFTGSTEVGQSVMQNAGATNLKRVTLELGGKSPNIIMDDCDLDQAVEGAHFGTFFNMGQCCCAGTRVYVHENIYDCFVAKCIERAERVIVGDPFELNTEQGPQINETQMKSILQYIDSGIQQGARLETGGCQIDGKGYFIKPTIFTNVSDCMTIAREEIFGPVQAIFKFCSIDEVIERANDSQYGLAGGLYTNNIDTVNLISQGLKVGTVWVNCYNVMNPQVPFGGFKMSGNNREYGEYGLQTFTEVKSVYIKIPKKNS